MLLLIDRYLIRSFLLPLVYCLLAFLILFIAYDLTDHIGYFYDRNIAPETVVRYYLYMVPIVLSQSMPFGILLALLYCLGNLSRNNEIIAMRASGITLFRIVQPYLVIGILMYGCTFVLSEMFVPEARRLSGQIVETPTSFRSALEAKGVAKLLTFVNASDDRSWTVRQLSVMSNLAENVEITTFAHSRNRKTSRIEARTAEYTPGLGWCFYDVTLIRYLPDGTATPARKFRKLLMRSFRETPHDIASTQNDPEVMTFRELIRGVRFTSEDSDFVMKLNMERHRRIAGPAACFVFVLLAVPFGVFHTRAGMIKGVITSILLCLGYYLIASFFISLGQKGMVLPVLAAWLPNVLFFGVGAALVTRMR